MPLRLPQRARARLFRRTEMGIEGAVRQAGSLHCFAHGHVLKFPFPEEAGSSIHDLFMLRGGFLWGQRIFSATSIYDAHHIQ